MRIEEQGVGSGGKIRIEEQGVGSGGKIRIEEQETYKWKGNEFSPFSPRRLFLVKFTKLWPIILFIESSQTKETKFILMRCQRSEVLLTNKRIEQSPA